MCMPLFTIRFLKSGIFHHCKMMSGPFFFYMPYLVKLTPKKTIVDLYSKLHASVRIDQLCPKTHMITRHLHKITSKCKIQHVKYLLFFIFVKYYSRRNDLERNPVLPWCYNICLSCSLY